MSKKSNCFQLVIVVSAFLSHYAVADTQDFQLKSGWNLIASDLVVSKSDVANLVNNNSAVSLISGHQLDNNEYVFKSHTGSIYSGLEGLKPGFGYWVKASEDTEITLTGDVGKNRNLQSLREGWNLVGSLYSSPEILMTDAVAQGRKISLITGQIIEEGGLTFKSYTGSVYSGLTEYRNGAGYWVKVEKAPAAYPGMASAADTESAHGKINIQGAPTGKIVEVFVDSLQAEAMSNDPLGSGAAIPDGVKVPAFPAAAYLDTDGSGAVETAVVADSAYSGKKLYMTVSNWNSTTEEYDQTCAKIESLGAALSTQDVTLTPAACPGS